MVITPLEQWNAQKLQITERPAIALLQKYQLGRLRDTLRRVLAHSRFYKEHLRGIDPESFQSMEDLARLPFTEPCAVAERPNDFLCVPPHEISRIVTLATSGTTGKPKRIAFTPEDQEQIVDFFHHGMTTLASECDRILIFLPGKTEGSVGDLLRKAVNRIGCEGIVFGPISDLEEALRAMLDMEPDCVVGIPSQLLALSRHRESGLPPGKIRLKSVLLSTDYAPQAIADSLARTWGCEVYEHYGMTEMGLGGAVECSAREGYHLREADLLFEIVDSATGRQADDGEYGEVVFSTLTRSGMPLVRYRTGDRSRFLTRPCLCGSILRRLERISGRLNEPVRLNDRSTISIAQLDEILFRDPCVSAYTAEIRREEKFDRLILRIKRARHDFDADVVISGIRSQLSIGDLVRIEVREGDPGFFTTGTAKRHIICRDVDG